MESSDFAHEMSLASGQRFFEKLASTGGTCDTYRVRINGKWHFLKRPKGEMSSNPLYITAFEREFDIGYRLEHKSLVRYIDKGIDQQGMYILTEMIDGCTLDEFVAKNPEYFKNKKHVERFVSQMLDVLDYLHNNQVLHLDLKPSNIIITRMGHNVKLVDLGFAYSDCYQDIAAGMTRKYAAPEQLNGGEVGPWTDIYAFGIVLLSLFNNEKPQDALQSVPSYYRKFVKKCVENDYDQRFATVADAQHFLSKHQFRRKIIVGILISIASLLILFLIFWNVLHTDSTSVPKATNESRVMPDDRNDSIEAIADDNIVEEVNVSHSVESPNTSQNRDDEINSKSASMATEPIKAITVPVALESQLHARAKAAFVALERQYTAVDDYKTRGDLMTEIKKARQEILEFAKSQASSNEGKEKYYDAALEIVNEEYERSNLPKIINTSE